MSKIIKRVALDGFDLMEIKDTGNMEVELGRVGDLLAEMIRSKKTRGKGDFLPAKVFSPEMKLLWSFEKEKVNGFTGIANLVLHKGEYVIVFFEKREIARVLPISDLRKIQWVKKNDQIVAIGGRPMGQILDLKLSLSIELKTRYRASEQEKNLLRLCEEIRKKQEEEVRQIRIKARKEKLEKILSRAKISVVIQETGKPISSIPVTEKEWQALTDQTPVILVESYDDETKEHGDLIEAFFVRKGNGFKKKAGVKKICRPEEYVKEVEASGDVLPDILGEEFFLIEDDVQSAIVVEKSNLSALNVNSGTLVACPRTEDDRFEVYRMKSKGNETVGFFDRLEL